MNRSNSISVTLRVHFILSSKHLRESNLSQQYHPVFASARMPKLPTTDTSGTGVSNLAWQPPIRYLPFDLHAIQKQQRRWQRRRRRRNISNCKNHNNVYSFLEFRIVRKKFARTKLFEISKKDFKSLKFFHFRRFAFSLSLSLSLSLTHSLSLLLSRLTRGLQLIIFFLHLRNGQNSKYGNLCFLVFVCFFSVKSLKDFFSFSVFSDWLAETWWITWWIRNWWISHKNLLNKDTVGTSSDGWNLVISTPQKILNCRKTMVQRV